MKPLTQSKNITILPVLIALTFACFALSPLARAVCQEGCLTNLSTALGEDALLNNTGEGNTATGWQALASNTTGAVNTASGVEALAANTTGSFNTAIGSNALFTNTTGERNTATGGGALQDNTTGSFNTANGFDALEFNSTGINNTATGYRALVNNNTGNNNTAHGFQALVLGRFGNDNTAIGSNALSQAKDSSNIALGSNAGVNLVTGSNNIYIGNAGTSSGESAKIRIGTTGTQRATFIAGISGVTVPAGVGVIVGTDGKLGTVVSSERFKDAIQLMDKASETILALKPVTFRYKHELDPAGIPQFGLVAEEVEKVNPDLVARDGEGKPYSVRYEAVNAMLLNEFLKGHREVQEQKAIIAEFKREIANLTATVKEQAAQIQKVSAQLELSKPAQQTVLNDQ